MKKFGYCFKCGRLIPIEYLEQIEFHEGHFAPGEIHHKLCCIGCIHKAEELGKKFEEDLKNNKYDKRTKSK